MIFSVVAVILQRFLDWILVLHQNFLTGSYFSTKIPFIKTKYQIYLAGSLFSFTKWHFSPNFITGCNFSTQTPLSKTLYQISLTGSLFSLSRCHYFTTGSNFSTKTPLSKTLYRISLTGSLFSLSRCHYFTKISWLDLIFPPKLLLLYKIN